MAINQIARHWRAVTADSVSPACRWNGYTSFFTTGAGSWGEPNDSCGKPGSYLYTNGGAPAHSQAMHSS